MFAGLPLVQVGVLLGLSVSISRIQAQAFTREYLQIEEAVEESKRLDACFECRPRDRIQNVIANAKGGHPVSARLRNLSLSAVELAHSKAAIRMTIPYFSFVDFDRRVWPLILMAWNQSQRGRIQFLVVIAIADNLSPRPWEGRRKPNSHWQYENGKMSQVHCKKGSGRIIEIESEFRIADVKMFASV